MAKINGGVNIPGPILPYDSKDTYPTHEDIYGKGGWKSVEDVQALGLIPKDRLKNGCIVRIVSANGGNGLEFYYDDTILGQTNPFTIPAETDPSYEETLIQSEAWKLGFRKWMPGYLPTKVSELENDAHYIQEITDSNGIPLDPSLESNKDIITQELIDRDEKNGGNGTYGDLAKAYIHRNTFTSFNDTEPIYGLVTVNEESRIDPELLPNNSVYVVILEGFFPDDFEKGFLEDDTTGKVPEYTANRPEGMNPGAKYFVTGNYSGEDPSNFMYRIAEAQSANTWNPTNPSKECIYINKAQDAAYICENLNTNLVCVGRGRIVDSNVGDQIPEAEEGSPKNWELGRDYFEVGEGTDYNFSDQVEAKKARERWKDIPLSANLGYWLKEQIEMVYECVIGEITSRLDQEIEDRRDADDIIRNYTVNSIPIRENPVVGGNNAVLTGYSKGTTGAIAPSDSINTAFSKLETSVEELASTGGAAAELISEHEKRRDNPHVVTRDQVGLGQTSEPTFAKLTATNGFFQGSDIRLKENIGKIEEKGSIDLVQFNWRGTGKKSYGVIADEVEKDYPEIVQVGEDGYKTVNYTEALIIKISQLENELKELKKKLGEDK